jgi:signal transduction histidine kinase
MEIKVNLPLTVNEETLIDMHSILNVLNVATYELMQMQTLFGVRYDIEEAINDNTRAAEILKDPDKAYDLVNNIESVLEGLREKVATGAKTCGLSDDGDFKKHNENLESILNILAIRAAEIQARHQNPMAWVRHSIDKLQRNFGEVLRAIERNSHGGYRIVNNIAEHEDGNYFVNFEISSCLGDHLYMPAVFQDVVRDLIANARKYTPPGGRIIAGLSLSEDELRFVISDNGSGIPPAEIETVVEYGKRGSNMSHRPTRGGGFGLTKAWYVTKKFAGRMWIETTGKAGDGCRIRINLPRPGEGFAEPQAITSKNTADSK